ncbi:iron ABC transporter permease [Thiotrichales bacterium 19S3-7]|nr:iron ABC transporter permease [Thiotrichales bacterium 19S3-7]MCF6800969.1 iron ABC transporter permease [Thiotrichales bacterium 19S3-11]
MRQPVYLSFILIILIASASFIFLMTGEAAISFHSLVGLLIAIFDQKNQMTLLDQVVLFIKLPVLVASLLVGIIYGFSGGLMQGLLRNPLADPGILGVSSGASLMVVLGLWFFSTPLIVSLNQNIMILILAAIGSGIVLMVMYLVSILFINGKVTGVLLAGIALASIFSSVLMLVMTFSQANNLHFALSWLMGGIQSVSWPLLGFDAVMVVIILFILPKSASALDILALGELDAKASGVNINQLLVIVLIGLSVMMAVAVSIAGPIAFVGLIAPHIVRLFGIRRHLALLINSALTGGLLVLVAEIFARCLFAPYILPLGAITALTGAPFFLMLLWRSRKLSLFI